MRLTQAQQETYATSTGLRLRSLTVDRPSALAMRVCLACLDRGEPPAFLRTPVVIDLDTEQRDVIRDALCVPLDRWVFDADAPGTGYREDWGDAPSSTLVGARCEVLIGDAPATDATRVPIRLESPGGQHTFGTGSHPATRLALEHLERAVRPGHRVIDVGTGSGVLAIAAARLGAAAVQAFDTDAAAVRVAAANVRANGVEHTVSVATGSLPAVPTSVDVVVANLISGTVIELMPAFARVLDERAVLIVSGVVVAREADVLAAAATAGLQQSDVLRAGRWCALVLTRSLRP